MRGLALGVSVAYLAGCASPGKPVSQVVRVETPGCAIASCTLSNDQGEWRVQATPGETSVITSRTPLRLVCRTEEGLENSTGAASSLSGTSGAGAVAGGLTGGAAVGAAFGAVALTFIPVLGIIIVASGVALGAAGGTALEASQQTLGYPPVISVDMSCTSQGDKASAPGEGRFGLAFRGLSHAELEALGLNENGAVLVTEVAAGGFAQAAGMRRGDIVLAINGRALVDATQFEQAALALAPEGLLQLRVWRDGQATAISLTLPSTPQ